MLKRVLASAVMVTLGTSAWADSDLLLIDNSEPGLFQRLSGFADLGRVEVALRSPEVNLSRASEATAGQMRRAFTLFAENLDGATEDVVVALIGQVVSTVSGDYLMPSNLDDAPSLAQVVTQGLPLDAVYAVTAAYPGKSLIILGDSRSDSRLERGLRDSPNLGGIPNGTTLAYGTSREALGLLGELASSGDSNVMPLIRRAGMQITGYTPRRLDLLENRDEVPRHQSGSTNTQEDTAAWQRAVAANTVASYEAYLAAFPNGQSAGEARQRLTAITSQPFYEEKQAEAALALKRAARREIQRDLSLLGYNTRGIDGIFGRGTRGAVAAWQKDNGLPSSGYLDAVQITRLDAQAERRAAELEEQARQRQAELDRQDRAFWSETGARGDEAGYRAYLKRFPDGIYSDEAELRLDAIEEQRRAQAENSDRAIWRKAREADTADAYRAYLRERPNGAFVQEARERIEWFTRNAENVTIQNKARAEENALGLNPAARRLAESWLQSLGLNPGAVDGRFDDQARRAIRRYQGARNLRVSGYLDQATLVRLMADTILQ